MAPRGAASPEGGLLSGPWEAEEGTPASSCWSLGDTAWAAGEKAGTARCTEAEEGPASLPGWGSFVPCLLGSSGVQAQDPSLSHQRLALCHFSTTPLTGIFFIINSPKSLLETGGR